MSDNGAVAGKENTVAQNEEPKLSATQMAEIQKLLMGGGLGGEAVVRDYKEWDAVKSEDGSKNMDFFCPRCPSKIARADTGALVSTDMVLSKYKVDGPDEESIGTWWLLPSAFAFENIGVTKTVGNTKFLSCADCEVGPLGWHDITDTTKYYIAAQRVRYTE